MKILVFDNYDSFTYNLVQLIEQITGTRPDVFRNDQIALEKINEYDKILLSPGPGVPHEAGLLLPLIETYAQTKDILGVCLGHQAIGEAFGGTLSNLSQVFHGVATSCHFVNAGNESLLFKGISGPFEAGRYHSWIVDKENLPAELEITAEDENGQIMAMQHKHLRVYGVQFHPESVLTPVGRIIIENWLKES